jgi:hypothetical protein
MKRAAGIRSALPWHNRYSPPPREPCFNPTGKWAHVVGDRCTLANVGNNERDPVSVQCHGRAATGVVAASTVAIFVTLDADVGSNRR